MKHGTKEGIGCNLGKHCEHFYPKMCDLSLSKGLCSSKHCKLKHVRGTKRIKPAETKPLKSAQEKELVEDRKQLELLVLPQWKENSLRA